MVTVTSNQFLNGRDVAMRAPWDAAKAQRCCQEMCLGGAEKEDRAAASDKRNWPWLIHRYGD